MKSICVYCGSSPGTKDVYLKSASELGKVLAAENIKLVYGGANIGLMGAVANAALDHGGEVIGVIPKALFHKEVAHEGLTQLEVVDDMHQRKARMAELAAGFITMPGGLGTLEELFEMLTWSQLGFHEKPIGLLNMDGYFDTLSRFLDQGVNQGFIKEIHQKLYQISESPTELVDWMRDYSSPIINKWQEK